MSLTAFKKSSVIQYGSRRSGKPPGGYWLPQGPFGKSTTSLFDALKGPGPVGFSLNGPYRNIGYIGKSSRMSKQGTPFRGIYPMGSGGLYGKYATPLPSYNVNEVIVLGEQQYFVKPSVLSTYGMLRKKYRWAYNGQYPNVWVQPNYGGSMLSDTKSQGNYISNISTANDCVIDVNQFDKYVGFIKNGGPTLCQTSTSQFTYNDMARNAPYTKFLRNPMNASQFTQRVQRRCTAPVGRQKPFPYAVNGDNCNRGPTYLTPPAWYTSDKNTTVPEA
jgi:hypothetical protein